MSQLNGLKSQQSRVFSKDNQVNIEKRGLVPAGPDLSSSVNSAPVSHALLDAERSGGSLVLPPLRPTSKGSNDGEIVDSAVQDSTAVSPARRRRKQDLLQRSMTALASSSSAAMEIPTRVVVSARDPYAGTARLVTEAWLNTTLDPPPLGQHAALEAAQAWDGLHKSGLESAGLGRDALLRAGLSQGAVDQVHRAIVVHSVGFFDSVREVVQHLPQRTDVLGAVWAAFLRVAEATLKTSFRSDYLHLLQAHHDASLDLLATREAATAARDEGLAAEKALAWAVAGHAEERALRVALKGQAAALHEELVGERLAQQAAVQRYCEELEARQHEALAAKTAQKEAQEVGAELRDARAYCTALEEHVQRLKDTCTQVHDAMAGTVGLFQLDETLVQDLSPPSPSTSRSRPPSGSTAPTHPTASSSSKPAVRGAAAALAAMRASSGGGGGVMDSDEAVALLEQVAALECGVEGLYGRWKGEIREGEGARVREAAAWDEAHRMRLELLDEREALVKTRATLGSTEAALANAEQMITGLGAQLESRQSEVIELSVKTSSQAQELLRQRQTLAEAELRCNEIQMVMVQMSTKMEESRRVMVDKIRLADAEARRVRQLQASSRLLGLGVSVIGSAATELQDKLEAAREVIAEQKAANQDLVARLSEKEKVLRTKEDEMLQRDERIKTVEGQVVDLKAAVMKAEGMATRAQQDAEEREKETAEKTRMVMDMQARVTRTEEELNTQTTALYETEVARDELKERLEATSKRLEAANQQLLDQGQVLVDLRKQLGEAVRSRVDAAAQAQEDQRLARDALRKAQDEKQALASELAVVQDKLRDMTRLRDEVTMRQEDAKRKWGKWKERTRKLQQDEAHLTSILAARNEAVDRLTRRVVTVEADIQAILEDSTRAVEMGAEGGEAGAGVALEAVVATQKAARQKVEDVVARMRGLQEQALEVDSALDRLFKERQKLKTRLLIEPDAAEEVQAKLEAKQEEVGRVTGSKVQLEAKLQRLRDELARFQAALERAEREAKYFDPHTAALTSRTVSVEKALQSEQGRQLQEAHDRVTELHREVTQQHHAYEDLKSLRERTDKANASLSANIDTCHTKIKGLQTDKAELEAKLRNCNSIISFLQADIANVKSERERIKGSFSDAENKLGSLERELEAARAALSGSLKRVEKKYEAEKAGLERTLLGKVQEVRDELDTARSTLDQRERRCGEVEESLQALLWRFHEVQYAEARPRWRYLLTDAVFLAALQRSPPSLEVIPNPFLGERLPLQGLSFSCDATLKLVSHIYIDKILLECDVEEKALADSVPPVRRSLEEHVYDFFLARWGTRIVVDAHVGAFLAAVRQHAPSYRRLATFLRLLGLPAPHAAPLPASAIHTYTSVLSRVHARYGPLLSEATEGQSRVPAGVVLKVVRDVMRGHYSSMVPEMAELSDRLRSLAGGDETKAVDLDVVLDTALAAWFTQRQADEAALVSLIRHADGKGRGVFNVEEYTIILKQVDNHTAENTSQREVLDLFRESLRASGPAQHGATPATCANSLLERGVVGARHARLAHERPVPPPYDDFGLLEESWKGMKRVLAEHVVMLEGSSKLKADVALMKDQAKQFEELLVRHESAGAAWSLYRRLLAAYATQRAQMEGGGDSHVSALFEANLAKQAADKQVAGAASKSNTSRASGRKAAPR